jgi:Ser/Thr protein kinase RdoA (MazF antagonist)
MDGSVADAKHWGHRMGELQRRLHDVVAPSSVPAVVGDRGHPFGAGATVAGLPDGRALLHLDWHPLNLLVDAHGEIRGIVDWDNARRGHAVLDVARTHAILTLDPGVATLPAEFRASLPAFLDAWAAGYGLRLDAIPAACRLWAARVMLADLEPRHASTPAALEPIRRAIERWSVR